jgi:hypothetical protein
VRAAAVLCALLAVPVVAHAELYKWVDERGVVNYGNKRPEGVKHVRQLDESEGRVSTIPAPPAAERQRQRELALAARVERLERELEALERTRAAPAPVVVAVPAFQQPAFVAAPAFFPAYGFPVAHGRLVRARGSHSGIRIAIGRPARR